MPNYAGAPTPADVLALLDPLATVFKTAYPTLGLGLEANTVAAKALAARANSVASPRLKAAVAPFLDALAVNSRYDTFFAIQLRQLLSALHQQIAQNLPPGWTFNAAAGNYLDLYLTRVNGTHPSSPPPITVSPTLTSATGGNVPAQNAGVNKAKFAWVSTQGDWIEGQPSGPINMPTINNWSNAVAVSGLPVVPAGVGKLRIYRTIGGGSEYYWDKDVAVTAGQAVPAITLTNPDYALLQDWGPSAWASCMLMPEHAAMIALATAQAAQGNQVYNLPTFSSVGIISPHNVCLNPAQAFLGVSGTEGHGYLSRWYGNGQTYELGYTTTNDPVNRLQGFLGAANLRLRAYSTLGGTGTVTNVLYHYLDASSPTTLKTDGNDAGGSIASAVGSILNLNVPAGRIVKRVTSVTITGLGGTAAIFIEAQALRAI